MYENLFTDESFDQDAGGWAVFRGKEKDYVAINGGGARECTIFDLELRAIKEAVDFIANNQTSCQTCNFIIHSDSQAAISRLQDTR